MKEYTIKPGRSNFRPMECILPRLANGFEFEAMLRPSCWWSPEDWQGDRDRNDWNKLTGMTGAFGRNNARAALIAFRPADRPNTFLLTGYTNDKRTGWTFGNPAGGIEAIAVEADRLITGSGKLGGFAERSPYVEYRIQCGQELFITEHPFDPAWHGWYRQTGTSIGGANNSPGPFGGFATQHMSLLLKFKFV